MSYKKNYFYLIVLFSLSLLSACGSKTYGPPSSAHPVFDRIDSWGPEDLKDPFPNINYTTSNDNETKTREVQSEKSSDINLRP
ncbi:MAG: hypothetical protein K1X44_00515 [Alphaproteobacteria bacterium]|nr:hypothetical protein [Alphaproteobacteria bacterium]